MRLRELVGLVVKHTNVKVRFGPLPVIARLALMLRGGIGGSSARETIMLFTKNWFYNTTKLRSLGWKQEIPLDEGMKETIQWLKSPEALKHFRE